MVEQSLAEAPAAVTSLSAEDIQRMPADDYGDLLRNVPGLNVSQTSVRDINVTGRGATSTLSNSFLTLLDGRSVYLDFFGITMYDLLPTQADEIDRLEVIRGPGSALYGANAMSGVVNVITRRPQDMIGSTLVVGTPYANLVHAAGDDDFSYRFSAGIFDAPEYDRPTGEVPGSNPPGQVYPDFENKGTTQKRFNTRFDWGLGDDSYITAGAGMAVTDGIIHTGIGPFDIDQDTELSYVQADWYSGKLHVGASLQMLDGNATNLLTLSADGTPLGFRFINDTYNVDISNTNLPGSRHVVTYGGNVRSHDFELGIAPLARSKNEWGVFAQDEIRLTDKLNWVLGVRYDNIDPLRDAVSTPRTSLIYRLTQGHTLRLSYAEAFRTPSAVNNFLEVSILQALAPGVAVTADAFGDIGLTEVSLKAWEFGYVGYLDNGMDVTVSIYRNQTRNSIDFFIVDTYNATNLPGPGPMLPGALIPCFAVPPGTVGSCPNGGLAGVVPSEYSYRNIGRTIDRGLEISVAQEPGDWHWWANLSWQDEPDIEGAEIIDANRAPEWRANLGVGQDRDNFFWDTTINYQDAAYWSDVLFARAATDGFTQVNASAGWRFRDDRLTVKLIGQNVFDEKLQQHIFGDIIDRKIAGQVSISF
jgi:iron complex outermembrane receptor protein